MMAVAAASGPAAYVPHVVSDRAVPLQEASDIRWVDDNHVLITDRNRGVARLALSGGEVSWLAEWPKPNGPGGRYLHLAASDKTVAVADWVFLYQWREAGGKLHQEGIDHVADLDLDRDGDRLLLVGWRRSADGHGADGTLAWLGSLRGGESSLRPILPYRSSKAILNCGLFHIGVVRFLHDGSFIVVPGAEPGIYLFSKDGKVQRVWATDAVGLDAPCDFSEEQGGFYAMNYVAREEWLNRQRVVDDIVETPTGPAVIARSVKGNQTQWDLLLVDPSGSISEQPLPVSSPSPWAHMAAATRGNRAVLLIGDHITQPNGAKPRLIMLEWSKK
jgi:hypothetical protein